LLASKWFVEIYNTSATPITVKNVIPTGYDDEIKLIPFGDETNVISPFSIPGGDHKRLELDVFIPLPIALTKIAMACKCKSFNNFKEYMNARGMDELGNFENFDSRGFPTGFDPQHPPKNAAVMVSVESATGQFYTGYGKWYAGLDRPKFL
jgi:hypothetical protein